MTALNSSMTPSGATFFALRQREEVKPLLGMGVDDSLQVPHAFLLERVETVGLVLTCIGPVRAAANVAEAVLSVKHECAGQDRCAGPRGQDQMTKGKVLHDAKKARALARPAIGAIDEEGHTVALLHCIDELA